MPVTNHHDDRLTIRQFMATEPTSAGPQDPIKHVLRLLCDHRIGAVLITDAGRLAGIFSERDLVRLAADAPPGWRDRPVGDVMTRQPHTIGPDVGWEEAMATMERFGVRHLPVLEHGRVVGIVSSRLLIAHRTAHLNGVVEDRTQALQEITGELIERDRLLQYELNVAGQLLSRALLPSAPPVSPDVRWSVRFHPLDALGGDYYDFVTPDEHTVGVLIADASGHSVPAAMVAMMARIAFAEVVRSTVSPPLVLRQMNERILGLTEERFVTAFFALYDRRERTLACANAGHPWPLHFRARDNACRPVGPRGLMLGIMPEVEYAEEKILLAPGDRLCFYTDGVTDALNADGEPFGSERLRDLLRDVGSLPADEIVNQIYLELAEFRGDQPPSDDTTVVVAAVS